MTTFDANANLAFATVTVAPAPAASGTSLTVDDASPFPADPFYALLWPPDVCATLANAEIVRVTNVAGNVFTITRAQGGTSAQTVAVGWSIANTLTAEVIDDIELAINAAEANIATIFSTAVFDGDAAGGVLSGTYPNPGLAAAVAGAALDLSANVLNVLVDGVTIQVNGSDQLEVIGGVVTDAVILAPASSTRNIIQPTAATFIPLSVKGFTGQSANLFVAEDSTGADLVTISSAGVLAVGASLTVDPGGFVDGAEISNPATPAANHARLYIRDSGGGLTQVVARFPSGNTVVVAEDF